MSGYVRRSGHLSPQQRCWGFTTSPPSPYVVFGGEVTMCIDQLFGFAVEALLNPVPFALGLVFAGLVVVGVGVVATKLLERYE